MVLDSIHTKSVHRAVPYAAALWRLRMGDKDTVVITTRIDWMQAQTVVREFLHPRRQLPSAVAYKQLAELITACNNARQRLLEQSGG